MKITTIALDVAKQIFQVHGADAEGRVVLRRRLRRSQVAAFFANVPPCVAGLEAEAICEAVGRPHMRFVPAKSVEQQDIQSLRRVRSRLGSSRTQLANQIRGLLMEYGIVLPQHVGQVRRGLPLILEDATNELTGFSRRLFSYLYEELLAVEEKIKTIEEHLWTVYEASEPCQRLAAVEGIGAVMATALVAALSDGKTFKNGRQFAAWLGLVPRQHSSGGKARLVLTCPLFLGQS